MFRAPKARLFWPLTVTLLLADCATKELAERHLTPSIPEPVVGDYLRFTLSYNPGAALSVTAGPYSRVIFSLTALVAVLILGRLYLRADGRATGFVVALALVIGGALGNLADRLRSARGVVDFIDVGLGQSRFWIFNLADVGVSIGAVLLAWYLTRSPPTAEPPPEPSS